MKSLNKMIRRILWNLGYDLIRFEPKSHSLARRKQILETYIINTILDVGANIGQYGKQLRDIGYKGKIVSFEPLSSAFTQLKKTSENDSFWEVHNFALGDKQEVASINIAGNLYSSSILDMLPAHIKSAPDSVCVGKETIHMKTLDSVFPDLVNPGNRVYLKIDTQGFERHVLAGAEATLPSIDIIQLEMSLVPLYKDELLFDKMYQFICSKGYKLIALEPGFTDSDTGELLQVDGIFHRI